MRNPKDRSAFDDLVYEIVKAIPRGKVMTYGGIAALIPHPISVDPLAYSRVRARWVGYAMASCGEDVPWHRVINAKGQVSNRPGHGPHIQQRYLEEEGVVFNAKGRISQFPGLYFDFENEREGMVEQLFIGTGKERQNI